MTLVQILQIIGLVLGGITGIAAIAALFGVAYSQFKKANRTENSDVVKSADSVVDFWKNQANDYKQMMEAKDSKNTTTINALTEKVGILTGQLKSEQEQNVRLEKIFQNRNPEMEAFMKYMVESSEKHSETHERMIQILTDIHKSSQSNHQILEEEMGREIKVESTVSKQ